MHYHSAVRALVPRGQQFFEGTLIVNDAFLKHVRDCGRIGRSGCVEVEELDGGVHELRTDVLVLATGFEHSEVGWLPKDLFPDGYVV